MYIPNQCDLHNCKKEDMHMIFRNFEPFEECWKCFFLHQHNLLHGTLDMHNCTVVPNMFTVHFLYMSFPPPGHCRSAETGERKRGRA